MGSRNGKGKLITLDLPTELVDQVTSHWPKLRQHPAIAALGPEVANRTTAVRVLLYLVARDLEAGLIPGLATEQPELDRARQRLLALLESRAKAQAA